MSGRALLRSCGEGNGCHRHGRNKQQRAKDIHNPLHYGNLLLSLVECLLFPSKSVFNFHPIESSRNAYPCLPTSTADNSLTTPQLKEATSASCFGHFAH